MALQPHQLPESFRKRMVKEQRKELGVTTMDEVNDKQGRIAERKMHDLFTAWLRISEIPFIHSRMDRKSTIREGWPDFTILPGLLPAFCVEMKTGNGQLSEAQRNVIAELLVAKIPVSVCYSVEEAIAFSKEALKL